METQTSSSKETTFGFKYISEGKKCKRCGKYLPLSFYQAHNHSADNYEHICCFCRKGPKVKERCAASRAYLRNARKELGTDEVIFKPIITKTTADIKPNKTMKATEPVKKNMTPVTDMLLALQTADDNTLLAEIRRRGYTGTLQVQRIETIAV